METIQREPVALGPVWWQWWLPYAARWLLVGLAALVVALVGLVVALRPPGEHIAYMAASLAVSGLVSIAIGGAGLWLVDVAQINSVRLKFAIPSMLAALVIALNALVAARLMFISVVDSQLLIAFLVFGVCLALVLSSSVAGSMARAIRRIELGARRIAAGEYSERLHEERLGGIQELAQLAHWFNQMATSVQDAFTRREAAEANRRQVLAALSHDVRTPLTAMRAMIEAIDDGVVSDPEAVRRYHSTIRAEMRHLSALIDDLFELSRIEAGTVPLDRAALNVEDLISDALEASHEQAERAWVTLTGQIAGELPVVQADARQVYRVVANLVQNALRYTPAGGVIVLRAAREQAQVVVEVIDTGEGIAAHDLPYIFEPAYRGEPSRKRHTSVNAAQTSGGTGLGLAIARGLVEAHGGTIRALSPLPPDLLALVKAHAPDVTLPGLAGTVVSFTLPIEGG